MGLQSHAYRTLQDELNIEPHREAQFLGHNEMVVHCETSERRDEILDALSYDFNPIVIKEVPNDGIIIRFDPMLHWSSRS